MLLGQAYSPANPIKGSSYSTYGYKSASGVVAFSVGDQAPAVDSYVTKPASGDMPTVEVLNGVITFSHPQTHSYFGIGDYVVWTTGSGYITKKISTRDWEIRMADGDVPANTDPLVPPVLTSIQKAFATLAAAISGAAGAQALIGADLVDKEVILLIPCYELASPSSTAIDITGWTTSETNYIRVFAPNDIATECNKSQRHTHVPGGFTIENTAAIGTLITCSSDNIIVDGLCFAEDISGCNIGIDMVGSGVVSNNMFEGFATDAIKVTEVTDSVQVINNTIYGTGTRGVSASASSKVIANTVYGRTNGFVFASVAAYAANNVAANNTTDYTGIPTDSFNNCSDDATAVGTACINSTNTANGITKFYDTTTFDFRLTNANDPDKIKTGLDLRAVSPYFITRDMAGVLNDSTVSMGSLHTIPVVPAAIGDTTNNRDVGGGVTFTIVDGLVVFTGGQTNPLLTAGCVLTHGGGSFTLLEKVSSTVWRITEDTGLAPADIGVPTAITSIYPKFASVSVATPPAANLVTNDTAWEIVCAEATATSDVDVEITGVTSDETRDITIYAPVDGSKSNSRLRHQGVWDTSLMHINSIKADDQGYVTILGLQVGTDSTKNAVHLENEMSRVEACIIKEAAIGVYVRPGLDTPSTISVLNNIIYDCDDEGIKLENDSTGYQSEFNIYNNTVYNNLYGISFDGIDGGNVNIIRLVNNLCLLNQKDYVGDGPRSSYLSTESNWSSDVSAFSYATNRNNDIFKTVSFLGLRDFHIPLAQQLLMSSSYAASADSVFQVYIDVDSEMRPDNTGWSIGADQYSAPSKHIAYFSVGSSFGTDLEDGATPTFDVVDSIATFSEALSSNIGIGDMVDYGGLDPFYLAEKGSSSVWMIVDSQGAPISDFSGTAATIERVSDTIANAFSTYVPLKVGDQDLVTRTMAMKIECYQDDVSGDPGNVSVTGWNTSADYSITIEAPFDEITQCGSRQRHIGVYSTGYFFLDTSGSNGFSIKDPYVFIDGLQFDVATGDGVDYDGALDDVTECRVERCLFAAGSATAVYQVNSTFPVRINSNIIIDPATAGLDLQNGTANNNTIINDSVGSVSYSGPATVTFANCIAQGTETGFSGLATKQSCVSEDASAGTSSGCKSSVDLDFYATSNYHLSRDDFEVINYGDSTVANLPTRDVDSTLITDLSIGAHCPAYTTLDQYFSCGAFSYSFITGSVNVSIEGSVATFTDDLGDINIMVGDELTYLDGVNHYVYLLRKISDNSWEVRDWIGQTPTSVSSKPVVSLKRTFNTIETLFDKNESSSISQFYGNATNPFIDLDKAKMNIFIAVAKDGTNSEPIDMVGPFGADAENHFTLFAPIEGDQALTSHRHTGIYASSGVATFHRSSTSLQTEMIALKSPYMVIDGIVITGNGGSSSGKNGIGVTAVGCKITNNIIAFCANGVESPASNLQTVIVNNIVFDCYYSGIRCSTADYVYNNTVYDVSATGAAGIEDTGGTYLYNNIVQNCPLGLCYAIGGSISNISDDTSGSIPSTSVSFINPGSYNFGLLKTDPRGVGKQLSADAAYPFDTDIKDVQRGRVWDCGAVEYQAEKTLYYSFGSSTNHLTQPADSSQLTAKISTSDGKSYATFYEAQVSDKLTSGDYVWYTTGGFYLAEKVADDKWRVTNADGTNVTGSLYNVAAIRRAVSDLSTLSAFISTNLSGTDLVSSEVQLNIVIADDTFGYNVSGGSFGFTSDPDYFFKIFSPIDTTKHCNVSQRHTGRYDSGSHIIASDSNAVLRISNTDYFQLEGVIITNEDSNGAGVKLSACTRFVLDSNIVRNCAAGGILCETDYSTSTGRASAIFNNIVNGCGFYGILISGDYANAIWVMNNTIADCSRGIHHVKGESDGVLVYMYNNILNNIVDIIEDNIANTGKLYKYYNISKDESAGDTNNNINGFDIAFIDSSVENFELDPDTDSFAIDSALDMQVVSPYYFEEDARGIARDTLFWDRGALERNENIGSGTMVLGPIQMQNGIGIITSDIPTTTIYLRTNETELAPSYLQFTSIALMNVYLAYNTIDNIIVYVEGGESFSGEFNFYDRGDATVHVQTDPSEIASKGFASIVYNPVLIEYQSVHGGATFENLMIYSVDAGTDFVIKNNAATEGLDFINCILQLNNEAICNNSTCTVKAINCILLYFNKNDSATLYLNASTAVGHVLINSILLADSVDDEIFSMCSGALSDYINNCITFNVGGGTLSIYAPFKILCQENVDPSLTEIEVGWQSETTSSIMTQSDFTPLFESTVVDNGNDSVVSTYSITTDILGNDRIFGFGSIDIGPYELEIHIFDISGSDIRSIDQSKCEIDRINKRVVSNNISYSGLYDRFKNDYTALEEFIREENITISLKQDESDMVAASDKPNDLLATFDANYDSPTMTILVKKIGGELSRKLGLMLENDLYVAHFNEQESKLYLYFNKVATLGLNGTRNPIKNVQFGGNPTFIG